VTRASPNSQKVQTAATKSIAAIVGVLRETTVPAPRRFRAALLLARLDVDDRQPTDRNQALGFRVVFVIPDDRQ